MRVKNAKDLKSVRTGPPAGPETIMARLSPEERSWFLDLIERLRYVERQLNYMASLHVEGVSSVDRGKLILCETEVRKVYTFLDNTLLGYPEPGCAHRETPVPEVACKKGGKR
jgi:hypothetical protein